MVGSFEEIRGGEHSVDEREYDILVTASDRVTRREHLHVLALAVRDVDKVSVPVLAHQALRPAGVSATALARSGERSVRNARPIVTDDILARQLDVPSSVSGRLRDLVTSTLIPVIDPIERRPRWSVGNSSSYTTKGASFAEFVSGVQALLTTHTRLEVLAFRGLRPKIAGAPEASIVALPVMPLDPARWLRWFLDDLRDGYPNLFPVNEDWRTEDKWTPPELRQALDAREELKVKREELLAQLEREEVAAQAAVDAQTRVAEDSHWRLVTDQGASLEAAVAAAFTILGFNVDLRDQDLAPGQPKLEDLRLTDEEFEGWVALVEVKGFEKGASPKGATQLAVRPLTAYIQENGEGPGALYYVVNHETRLAPPERPTALSGDSAVDLLAAHNGALIDTRDLLTAVLTVTKEPARAPSIRKQLRESRGRWRHTN